MAELTERDLTRLRQIRTMIASYSGPVSSRAARGPEQGPACSVCLNEPSEWVLADRDDEVATLGFCRRCLDLVIA